MAGLLNSDFDCKLMALCYEYVRGIRDIEKSTMRGIFGLYKFRTEMHERILKLTGLDRSDLYHITNNIDYYKNPQDLYFAISDICEKHGRV